MFKNIVFTSLIVMVCVDKVYADLPDFSALVEVYGVNINR